MCCRKVNPMMFTTKDKAEEFIRSEVIRKVARYYDREINKLRFIKEPGKRLTRYKRLCRAKLRALEHL